MLVSERERTKWQVNAHFDMYKCHVFVHFFVVLILVKIVDYSRLLAKY
jgi:hypothetical protein